jgi:hypothetical protein
VLFDITQLALECVIEGAGKRHEALAANLAVAPNAILAEPLGAAPTGGTPLHAAIPPLHLSA